MTLLAFLREECPDAPSVKSIKRSIEAKRCTVNGRLEIFSTHPLKIGDEVILDFSSSKEVAQKPFLLWEDEWLRAFDKPAGVVCSPQNFKGFLVHRLDKETSGVVLVAKTNKFLELMIDLFRQKKVNKTYLALVNGVVKGKKGVITSRLEAKHRYQGQTIYGSGKKGRVAETHWKVLSLGPKATLLECHPITGRTHQIRVHLKEMGHPILGDMQYGRDVKVACRHLLHAYKISFPHPITGEQISLKAPLPADFLEASQKMGIVL
jgi:23S rRNA-/tRNA-specific pseudouridylate synthase